MENELSCSNYGMLMEMTSDQIANCYFQTNNGNNNNNWENSMDQNDPFESALSSMVSSPTSTPLPAPSSSNGGMMIRELIGRLGSICNDCGEISPQKSSIVNGSTNDSCYSTPLNSPPPSRFNLSSLIMMGNNHNHQNINNNNNSGVSVNFPANHLGSLNADPGFVERAAKFSCFGNSNVRNFAELGVANVNHHVNGNYSNNGRSGANLENGKLSRVNSEKKMNNNGGGGVSRGSSPENGELGDSRDSREGSSLSEQNPGVDLPIKAQNDAHNSRKRKYVPKSKVKDAPLKDDKVEGEKEGSDAKRSKLDNEEAKKENAGEFDSSNNKEKQSNNNNNNSNNSNNSKETEKPEPPKDYIHVRARRGQATDSHSLAERVRREKISERMKFLQDLVPGCNKVTGKATVLDEIINYVQSLQRQVEFLSMKLSTVNPRMEFNMEALLSSKDMLQSKGASLPQAMYPLDQNSAQAFPYGYQSTQQMPMSLPNGVPNGMENHFLVNPMNDAAIRRHPSASLPSVDGFTDSINQLPSLWQDDLHSIVQMGIVQNQTHSVPGAMPNAQMKPEL